MVKVFHPLKLAKFLPLLPPPKLSRQALWAIIADKTGQQLAVIRLGALLALLSFSALFWLNNYWPITFCLALFSLFWTAILPQLEVLTLTSLRHSSKIYARVRSVGQFRFYCFSNISWTSNELFRLGGIHFFRFIYFSGLIAVNAGT